MSGQAEYQRSIGTGGFDGRLDRPFETLSTEERLRWLWEMMVLRASIQPPPADAGKLPVRDALDKEEPAP